MNLPTQYCYALHTTPFGHATFTESTREHDLRCASSKSQLPGPQAKARVACIMYSSCICVKLLHSSQIIDRSAKLKLLSMRIRKRCTTVKCTRVVLLQTNATLLSFLQRCGHLALHLPTTRSSVATTVSCYCTTAILDQNGNALTAARQGRLWYCTAAPTALLQHA